MNFLLAGAAVFILALGGLGMLRLVWPRIVETPPTARLGLGYCAGTFLAGFIFFLAYLAGIAFSRWLVVGPMMALGVVGIFAMRPIRGKWPVADSKPWLAGVVLVTALVMCWMRPVFGYDAIMMWALKAKIAYFARTWPATMFDPFTTAHTEYPPVVPSAQAFVFFWMGEFDDVASRLVFVAWLAAGAAILWWLLGELRASSRPMWVLWWCAMPAALVQVDLGYADIPVAVYALVFFGALAAWMRTPQREDFLRLAGVFGGMAFWIKQDALIAVGAGLAALCVMALCKKVRWLPVIGVTLMVGLLATPWKMFVWVRNLPGDFSFPPTDMMQKTIIIAGSLFHYLFLEGGFAFFWMIVAGLVWTRRARLRETWLGWLGVSGLFMVGAIFGVYGAAKDHLTPLLATSMERVLIGLMPLGLLLGAGLWRGRLKILRCESKVALAAVLMAAVMFWLGRNWKENSLRSDFVFGVVVIGMLIVEGVHHKKVAYRKKRHSRFLRFAWVLTIGMAFVSILNSAHRSGELFAEYGGKTLGQQHRQSIPDPLVFQMAKAVHDFPEGSHVNVLPKRSLWRHVFYYETFPMLVVDGTSSNTVRLSVP